LGALSNKASTSTAFTYDPFGNTATSGGATTYPFRYQGLEKELTDPGSLYYTGGGQYYKSADHALAVGDRGDEQPGRRRGSAPKIR